MYGRAYSTFLSRGRSTPAILAKSYPPKGWVVRSSGHEVVGIRPNHPFTQRRIHPLPLSLFMLGVLADHANNAFALDDLAFLANFLYRRSYLHRMVPECSPASSAAKIAS